MIDPNDIPARIKLLEQSITDSGFKLPDEKFFILSRDEIIKTNETDLYPDGRGREYTEQHVLPAVLSFWRAHVKAHGWFYPEQPESLMSALQSVKSAISQQSSMSPAVSRGIAGSAYLKSVFKSYWHVSNGPVDSFWNDKKFTAVLRYRLGLNTSKLYDYDVDGKKIQCRETFDINIKNVRFGFIAGRNNVSWFRPCTAADIYKRFLGELESPRVWDPSVGFGARLLGFAAMYPKGTYVGTEPAAMTFADNEALRNDLLKLEPELKVGLHKMGSEKISLDANSLDLVMTSPPYFNKERYFDEPGQCWRDFATIDIWFQKYLLPTCQTAFAALKPGKYMVINIDDITAPWIEKAAAQAGFLYDPAENLLLPRARDHFAKLSTKANMNKSEPILVFKKPV